MLKELENKAGSVRSCGLEPAMLPLLVEHNPSIASEASAPQHPKHSKILA